MTANVSPALTNGYNTNNIYAQIGQPSMANDFWGSQIFGTNPFGYQQNQPMFTSEPNDLASLLVQQHAGASNVQTAPTMQDYMYATQVANMFANQTAMLSPYTSFTQNDIFAQQTFPMMFNNGQTIV